MLALHISFGRQLSLCLRDVNCVALDASHKVLCPRSEVKLTDSVRFCGVDSAIALLVSTRPSVVHPIEQCTTGSPDAIGN